MKVILKQDIKGKGKKGQMIDAAEGNELIGMAVVSTPAYPEATALALVAEDGGENTKIRQGEDEQAMNEDQKKIAELEARLMLAEQKSENDEELRNEIEAKVREAMKTTKKE